MDHCTEGSAGGRRPLRSQRASGFQPAMVQAHSRACALSVMPRKRWRAARSRPRQFAPLHIDGADACPVLLSDDEHRWAARGKTRRRHQCYLEPRDVARAAARRSLECRTNDQVLIHGNADDAHHRRCDGVPDPRCADAARCGACWLAQQHESCARAVGAPSSPPSGTRTMV